MDNVVVGPIKKKKPKKIPKGEFCEKVITNRGDLVEESFAWRQQGVHTWLLVGCPVGYWRERKKHCRVANRGYKLLVKKQRMRKCPKGTVHVTKE